MSWTPCDTPTTGDIIRWTEPLWAPPVKKRGKPDKIGEQLLTAEVLAVEECFELQVRAVQTLSLDAGAQTRDAKVKSGDRIKRKKTTIALGNPQRLEK